MRPPLLSLALFALFGGCSGTGDKAPEDEGMDTDTGAPDDSGGDETGDDTGGETDEETEVETDVDTDVDGDGHADSALGGDDCDDANAAVFPGAEDVCDDGVDGDCDGSDPACAAWESGALVDLATAVLIGENDDDRAGGWVSMGDVDGDGRDDYIVTASQHSGTGYENGVVYIVPSPVYGEVDLGTVATRVDGMPDGEVLQETIVGDANGDGFADLLVADVGSAEVYLLHGPLSGATTTASAALTLNAYDELDWWFLGASLDMADLDGDGLAELVLGVPGDGGRVFLFPGNAEGAYNRAGMVAGASVTLSGVDDASYDGAASTLAHADVDGDGIEDLLVGDQNHMALDDGSSFGAVLLLLGPIDADMPLADADAVWETDTTADWAYAGIGGEITVGDLDGDGAPEAAIVAANYRHVASGAGAVFIVDDFSYGSHNVNDARAVVLGGALNDGVSEAVIGDVDGDGSAELVIGARGLDGETTLSGAVCVFSDLPTGTLSLDAASATFTGSDEDGAGTALALGDAQGTGALDVLVGAFYEGPGRAYILSME